MNGLWLAGSIQNLAVQRMSRCKKYVVGVVLTWVKACSLRAMDTLNIKGLQHLLVNVVVLLDLNLQTTNEFARGK